MTPRIIYGKTTGIFPSEKPWHNKIQNNRVFKHYYTIKSNVEIGFVKINRAGSRINVREFAAARPPAKNCPPGAGETTQNRAAREAPRAPEWGVAEYTP
jgi:hypothetical protein